MDDLTLRYFDAEMRYLREAAKAFAQAHPDRAAMLDLDKAVRRTLTLSACLKALPFP
ncbi:type VI secretion system baseplate subunit TssF [Klebsiella pneumoniae]|nr:type VI secretion system baseplate subunit TssF [Klebsiella pneumoniae]